MKAEKGRSAEEVVGEARREIVEKVIEDMKRDGLRWSEPYLPTLSPSNPCTGTVYRGANRAHLGLIARIRGYDDSRWATFKQISDAGWKVKKGARSAIIEKWKRFSHWEDNKETGEKELLGTYPKLVGYWRVFNAAEIDGIPPLPTPDRDESERCSLIADAMIASSRCGVVESDLYLGQGGYAPVTDRILIAPRETFTSDEGFTRVLLHEMTHSTGHPSALAREMDTSFGSESYAQEELVAELGSLFLSSDLGLQGLEMEGSFYDSHVCYLQSWLKALENDPSCLFRAASKAEKADAFIMERYEGHLERNPELAERIRDKSDRADGRESESPTPNTAPEANPEIGSPDETR